MYLSYATARDTYDPQTGYNKFGYNKDGYDQHGYGVDGYDKNGYNSQGLDRDGKDRLGKGSIGRFFAGSEHQEKISRMNEEDRKAKEDDSQSKAEKLAKLEAARARLAVAKAKADTEVAIAEARQAERKARNGINTKSTKEQFRGDTTNMKKNNALEAYKKVSDKASDIKNFRLYYKDKPTNLVWYGGKIIYVPKDYFLMQNLVNIHHATGRKCVLYKPEVNLIDEMKEKNIIFTLAEDIEELMNRLNASGLNKAMLLSDELGVETTSNVDYSEFDESIYDEDGSWEIKS